MPDVYETMELSQASRLVKRCGSTKQEVKPIDPALQKMIDAFFKNYESNPENAIDYIFSTNKSFMPQQIIELKGKLASTATTIGAFNGIEQITTKNTSQSLVLMSYLVKHEKQPLRFTFIFYKPKDQWILYKFKFDDNVDAELEESGRIYFIK
eukprot:gene18594-22248_t